MKRRIEETRGRFKRWTAQDNGDNVACYSCGPEEIINRKSFFSRGNKMVKGEALEPTDLVPVCGQVTTGLFAHLSSVQAT